MAELFYTQGHSEIGMDNPDAAFRLDQAVLKEPEPD